MHPSRFDSLELDPDAVGWRDPTDATDICEKLLTLSDPDQPEPTLGLSLFVRAHLPYDDARSLEAAEQLLDLTYCGENRAWLASLCGNLPQDMVAAKAAGFCAERLLAGSKDAWFRVLPDLPEALCAPRLDRVMSCTDKEIVSGFLEGFQLAMKRPTPGMIPWLKDYAFTSDDSSFTRWYALAILLAHYPDEVLSSWSELRANIADYLGYFERVTSVTDCLLFALIAKHGDEELGRKCKDLLLSSLASGSAFSFAGDIAAALCFTRSPLLTEFLSQVCTEGEIGRIHEVALALGPWLDRDKGDPWLEDVFTGLPDVRATYWIGSALGLPSFVDSVWASEYPPAAERDQFFLDCVALTRGGDPDGTVGLLALANAAGDAVRSSATDANTEPTRSHEQLRFGLATALSLWARYPASVAPLRWKVLLGSLRAKHDKPDDMAFFSTQQVLLGMCELCRRGQLPRPQMTSVSERARKWMETQLPLENAPDSLAALYAVPCSWATARSARVVAYQSAEAVSAPLLGKELPLDDDQQAALDVLNSGLSETADLIGRNLFVGSLLRLREMLEHYRRAPIRGRKRQSILGEIHVRLALCCGAIVANEESDGERLADAFRDLPHSYVEELCLLSMRHTAGAIRAVLAARDQQLARQLAELLSVQSDFDILSAYLSTDRPPELHSFLGHVAEVTSRLYELVSNGQYEGAVALADSFDA